MALAVLGVYSLVSFSARQQEREVAIRVAMGARPDQIVRLLIKQNGPVVLGGVAAGLLGALALGQALRTQLFGVLAADPLTLVSTALALVAAAALAMIAPARRAARVDPATMLRLD
jgi:ABC-type antimicrobial peptide transport system permease subunit